MKAAAVKGPKPRAPLGDSLQRIVAVRLDEVCAFMPAAQDPGRVVELHDMRIATKRLRYVLEICVEMFGPYTREAVKRTKALQDVLGEIHDCDVTLPQVYEVAAGARARDVAAVLAAADGSDDLAAGVVVSAATHADDHRGLATLAVYLQARRRLLFGRFQALWRDLEREGFRARLHFAIGERPSRSHDDHAGADPGPPARGLPSGAA